MLKRKKNLVETTNDGGENAIQNKEIEGLSQGQIVRRRFVRHKAAMTSVFVLVLLILIVFTSLESKIGPFKWRGWWKFKYDELLDLRTEGCPEGDMVGCPVG